VQEVAALREMQDKAAGAAMRKEVIGNATLYLGDE
jgi:hypothetical protein